LARRRRPAATPFLAGKRFPLLWGWRQISEIGFGISALADVRFGDAPGDLSDSEGVSFALLQLAYAYALPELAGRLPSETWWALASRLRELAIDAQQLRAELAGDPEQAVRQQLLAGELPLALGFLFPELRSLRALREAARGAFSEALVEWTDGQGLPHGRLLDVIEPLWACWTRARWMGERMKRGCWSREAEVQYQWLVRHALRLTHTDGRFMLKKSVNSASDDEARPWPSELYAMALDLVGDAGDHAAAAAMLPRGVRRLAKRKPRERDLPEVSLNSEWSGVAVLATNWSRSAARFAAAWADEPMRMEVSAGRERLLMGKWRFRTTNDGEPVRVAGEWEQTCWQSDEKCDYLELSVELSHDLRLERQILLAREDRLVYLADIVLSADGSSRRLSHTMELPISAEASWQPADETRDGVLSRGKERAAVLPLALSEWRSDPRGGRLEFADGCLMLTQEATGRGLCCPLLIDLDRRRAKRERTWRQLTVAEMLQAVPPDVAVGYRAQSGRRHWLFYRSLGPAGNRTVLGQNIAGEFCSGRMHESGKFDEWIEIEPC
jgi:hypothetical protein